MRFTMLVRFVVVLTVAGVSSVASGQFGDLIKRVPGRANTLVLLNVDQIHSTPLAQKEGWRERHEKQFAAGLVILPPQTSKFAMAAQMDFEYMQPQWETALLDMKYEPSIPKIAAKLGGTVDNIADQATAVLPQDVYVVKFGPRFAAIATPANRQNVAHWINQIYSNSLPPLSAYLQEAVRYAEGGSPIIMAMDFSNVFSPAYVRSRLETSETLQGRDVDLDQVSEVLASIKGVTLGVTINESLYGAIKVDFEKDATTLGDFAKPLLLEALTRQGAMIEEFRDWQVKIDGTQIQIGGTLYESGMRRILSILDAPPSLHAAAQESTGTDEESKERMTALATQQYYKSVVSLVDDLRGRRKSEDFVTWGQVGMWFEKYARKIDRLPILSVDPEMLDYGAFVADSFRQAESAMKGIGARSGYRKTQLPNYYNVNTYARPVGVTRWGVQGVYGYRATEDLAAKGQAESKVRTQERIRGNMSANMIVQGVEAATADIRRRMTEKYQMEF